MKIKITCRPRYNPLLKKYLNTKTFSKMLAFGILLNSIPINSFAGILSDDGRYETFEGSDITINDVLEEDKVDVGIEGNTLVNIFDPKDIIKVNGVEISKDKITVKNIDRVQFVNMFNKNKTMIKPNTTYTVFVNVFENNIPENDVNNEKQPNGLVISSRTDDYGDEDVFYSDTPNTQYRNFKIEPGETGLFKTILHTRNDINTPKFFLRMFMRDDTFNENTKVSFNVMIIEGNHMDKDIEYFEGMKSVGELESLEIISTNLDDSESNRIEIPLSKPLRGLPNGVKDKIIKKNNQWFVERNIGEITLNGSEDWFYNSDTSYCNKYVLPNPKMKSYPDGPANNNIPSNFNVVSDNLLPLSAKLCVETDMTGISSRRKNITGGFILSVNKVIASNLDKMKEWLSLNNTTVLFELATPIYEPLNIDSTINTYLDTTHISTNSTIPANLKVTVDRTINRATEAVELAKINPTTENLSLARMWTNLLRESIKKDELQSELNNNIDMVDLQLERKTASSNIDIYIKSENILMMNLSTNSITFDDFSGVEDMVKENAVNISINSSLPYNLNAYLATEIQNSDKSTTINKDILSIKDNSELDYQTFTNTTDKVVLKSNCNSGNDKQHNINLKLNGGIAHEKDVYKTTIKFEAEQQ